MVKKAISKLNEQFNSNNGGGFFLDSELPNVAGASDWFSAPESTEGQLAVDVYQTATEIVIKAPVAGVNEDELNIIVRPDMVTISGERHEEKEVSKEGYHTKECFWGSFSRSITLPAEGEADQAKATFKNGILTIRMPKSKRHQAFKLRINH